jgi:16S rRNA (guanine527-N7)-methyltransferase
LNLKEQIIQENIELPANFFNNIQKYKEHLFKWNKIHNLTGARDEATMDAFIFDAIYPLKFLPKVHNILDIGTGAGFPGMILAIALPETQVTLAEPLVKRASFLQFIKADLGLDNVKVVKQKVQEMPHEIFELITSRAVTDTKMLLELSKEFRNDATKLLFYKGEKVFDEVLEASLKHKVIQANNRHYLLLGES